MWDMGICKVSLYYSDFKLHLFHVTSSPSSVFNTNDNCNVIFVCECLFLKLTINYSVITWQVSAKGLSSKSQYSCDPGKITLHLPNILSCISLHVKSMGKSAQNLVQCQTITVTIIKYLLTFINNNY